VSLVSLLGVVVDEFLDVGLDESDFGEDLVCGGRPGEGFGAGLAWRVMMPNQVSIWLIQDDPTPG